MASWQIALWALALAPAAAPAPWLDVALPKAAFRLASPGALAVPTAGAALLAAHTAGNGLSPPRRRAGAIAATAPAAPTDFELTRPIPELGTSPYQLDPILHGALTAGMLATVGALELVLKPALTGGLRCAVRPGQTRCDAAELNGFDRLVVGARSEPWADVSDVTLGLALGGAVMGTALDVLLSGSATPGHDMLSDGLVLAETVAVGMLASSLLKLAVRRGRPSQYDPSVPLGGFDDQLSFPSGHTSTVASAAFGFATTFWLRHPDSSWKWVVGGGALAATALTGYSRVAAGRHFPTDALAGGLLGAGLGIAVPLLHHWLGGDPREPTKSLSMPSFGAIGSAGGHGLSWTFTF